MNEQAGTALTTVEGAADAFEAMLGGEEPVEDSAESTEEHSEQVEDEVTPDEEPVEGEESSTEEETTEEQEVEEQDDSAPELFTVKVNGEEKQVTADELVRGYQLQADYTQKTQALAQQRKEFEGEVSSVREERAQLAQLIQVVGSRLNEMTPQVDWERLRVTDPIEFAAQWAQHQMRQQELANLQQIQENLEAKVAEEEHATRRQMLQAEAQKLLEVIPEWKDPEKAKAGRQALREYGQSQGFTPEEISGVMDHRAILILHKAHKYDALMKKKPAVQSKMKEAPVLKPGTTSRPKVTEITRAKQRLAQTGRVDHAAQVFEQFL